MTPPDWLVHLLEPWAHFYEQSKGTQTAIIFVHIGGVLLAGGFAIAADRSTLRALRVPAASRSHHLQELGAVHRWVIGGLALVALTGLAQLASDVETFFGSWIFWTKMGLVILLAINGLMMTRAEASLARDPAEGSKHWRSLRRAALVSLSLWFLITLAGVALLTLT